jgi:4-amino-4-deoxy-L-arabinose transferase-like glycosyltransferase
MINRRHFFEGLFVVAVCSVFGFLVICFARSSSATYDEPANLAAGYSYLRWNDYRLGPEHPPLIKELAAVPLMWHRVWPAGIELTKENVMAHNSANSGGLTDSATELRRAWASTPANMDEQWNFSHFFFYGVRNETLQRLGVEDSYSVEGTTRLSGKDFYNDADELLFCGRMVTLLLGVLLAVLVYFWARELFGFAGAALSILLFCCDPNMVAHSGLVTTDLGVTLFIFGAMYFLWRICRRIEGASVILFLSFFALAFVTKFSAVLLVPMFLFASLARMISSKEWPLGATGKLRGLLGRVTALLVLFIAAGLSAFLIVWATYGFHYSAARNPQEAADVESAAFGEGEKPTARSLDRQAGYFPLAAELYRDAALTAELKLWPKGIPSQRGAEFDTNLERRIAARPLSSSGRLILFASKYRLLPEAYLFGFAHFLQKAHARGAFLRGEYSESGFRTYYLWTFLLKTPLPILLAMGAAIIFAFARYKSQSWIVFIAGPVVLYWFVAILAHVNIGHRYLLPIYPFLYVLCGLLAVEWRKLNQNWRWSSAFVSLSLLVISSQLVLSPPWRPARIHAHYLAYFNELSGGPRNGVKNLVDSNLDWGQELKGLKAWLEQRNINEPIWLCCFGTADPRFYQIRHWNVPRILGGYEFESSRYDALEAEERYREALNNFTTDLQPGQYIAVSATNLSGVYLGREVHDIWQRILEHCTLVDQIGYAIFVYRFDGLR